MTAATPVPEHDTFGTPDGRTYSAPEAAATPGRAAYEVGDRVRVTGTVVATNRRADWVSIDAGGSVFSFGRASSSPDIAHAAAREPDGQLLSDHLREQGRPGVAAMIEDAERAAREPHAADGLAAQLRDLAKHWEREYVSDQNWPQQCARELVRLLDKAGNEGPQPAPGLAAARPGEALAADNARLRDVITEVLGWFGDNGSGRYARVSGTVLARAYAKSPGVAVPEELRRFL